MRQSLAALALTLVVSFEAGAQSKVTGKWLVRYEREVRVGHMGSVTSQIVTDSVRVSLRQKGDSILGEWQSMSPIGESPKPPRTLVGIARGETARLEVDPNVTNTEGYFSELGREIVEFLKEHIHGIQPMTTKLELSVHGDSLIGTRWSSSADGVTETSRRPVVGVRDKP